MDKWLARASLLCVIHGLCLLSLRAQDIPSDSPREVLAQALHDYESGEYTSAINKLENSLKYFEDPERIEAYKYLAFCHVYIGDATTAKDYFKDALKMIPKLELNTDTVTPEILEVFEQAKKERAHEAAMCSCFIPGWGQMLKGDDAKGRMIMIASGITLFATTISWVITQTEYNDYVSLGPNDIDRMDEAYETYNRWYKTSLFTSTIFLSIYVYSICDAMFTKTRPKSSPVKSKEGFSCIFNNKRISVNYTLSF